MPDHDPYEEPIHEVNERGQRPIDSVQTASANPSLRVVYCTSCGVDIQAMRIGQACPNCGATVGKMHQTAGKSSGKAIAALVLGICSIVGCLFYGIPGLVCGILAIYFARKVRQGIEAGEVDISSKGMSDAGRICGIVGTCLSIVFMVLMIGYFIFLFTYLIPQSQQNNPPSWQSQPSNIQPAPPPAPAPTPAPVPSDESETTP